MTTKNNYKQYLPKEDGTTNDCQIVIKRGFVMSKDEQLIKNKNASSNPFKIKELVHDGIKYETKKIHRLIDKANGEIYDLLQLKEIAGDADEQAYNLEIELIADNLFDELSNSMKYLTKKAYKSFIFRLYENSSDTEVNVEYLYNYALLDEEIYGKINSWIENLKRWFLDNLNQSSTIHETRTSLLCYDFLYDTFENTTKSFFDNVLVSIENFFGEVKNRVDRLISNTVSLVETESKKFFYYYIKGVDCYQVVLSNNANACEKCQEMAGKTLYLSELKIDETAPPFHPNCGCTIIGKRTVSNIDEPLTLANPSSKYDREGAVSYAIQWYDDANPGYPSFGDRGDCTNFVSQCLVAGGFKMNEYWFCYNRNEINPFSLFKQELNWSYTEAWAVAKDQYEYLKNSDMVKEELVLTSANQIADEVNDPENPVKAGDVMYLKWDHNYPHHATIISKVEDGMIYYAAHTRNVQVESLSNFFDKYSEGQAYILKIK